MWKTHRAASLDEGPRCMIEDIEEEENGDGEDESEETSIEIEFEDGAYSI